MKTSIASASLVLATLLAASTCHAVLITSASALPGALVIDFQQFTTSTPATFTPVQVGGSVGKDVELFGEGFGPGSETRVGPINHSLAGNGSWNSTVDGDFLSAYLPGSNSTSMRFVFNDGPVSGVGGLMNYAPGFAGQATIQALDAGGLVIESYNLTTTAPISTPGGVNQGAFRGILRPTADIYGFRVANSFATIDDLAFVAVPEPTAASLAAIAAVVALIIRSRRGAGV
jgi:hypothetical protein